MPEWDYSDRVAIRQEEVLWIVRLLLLNVNDDDETAWTKRIDDIKDLVEKLAKEIEEYNGQFET